MTDTDKLPHINVDYFEDLTGQIPEDDKRGAEDVGKRIRQLREERHISIEDLSHLTGFSVSRLKNIESGREKPQLGTVMKLSKALDAALGRLVSGMGDKLYSVTRKDQRKQIHRTHSKTGEKHAYSYMSLAPEVRGRHMEPLIVRLEKDLESELSIHNGEEFIFVLEGIVHLSIGKESYNLEPGDSAYYLSTTSHCVSAKSKKATLLAVLYE